MSGSVRGDAEDRTSDVFVTVAERLSGFEGDERNLRSWVFAIAYRKVGESWKRTRRRRTEPAPLSELASHLPAGDAEAEAFDGLGTAAARAAIPARGSPHPSA